MANDDSPSDKELQRKVEELLSRPVGPVGKVDDPDPVHGQLAEIEARARKIRGMNPTPEPSEWNLPKTEGPKRQQSMDYRGVGIGIVAAYTLIGPIIIGYGIGWFLDKGKAGPHTSQTYGALAGTVFGFIAFVITLVRAGQTDPKK